MQDLNRVDQMIGQNVQKLRKALDMPLETLASKTNIPLAELESIEGGTARVHASQLFSLSRALNTDIEHFFKGLGQ